MFARICARGENEIAYKMENRVFFLNYIKYSIDVLCSKLRRKDEFSLSIIVLFRRYVYGTPREINSGLLSKHLLSVYFIIVWVEM